MATQDSGTGAAATPADTVRYVLDAFSAQQDRIYAVSTSLRARLEKLRDKDGDLIDPVALTLCELLVELGQDARIMHLAERLLGVQVDAHEIRGSEGLHG